MPASSRRVVSNRARLVHVEDCQPGLRRLRHRGGFRYVDAAGRPVRDHETLKRIRAIAVPPAWTHVWICTDPSGHLQATGRDAAGRKQYRYHRDFRRRRDRVKFSHVAAFAEALRRIRARVEADLRKSGLPREKVVAAVVHLLDTTLIRVGNREYAQANGSYGLTTLLDRHVAVNGAALRFEFKGKSGKLWQLDVSSRRVARVVRSCRDLPGQHLFQYVGEDGERHAIGSADVNAYLRDIASAEVTAKDFRTFAGTVLAGVALASYPPAGTMTLRKANVREAIEQVAHLLGNTPAVTRNSYVHPEIVAAYLDGRLALRRHRPPAGLSADEAAVARFLKGGGGRRSAPRREPRARRHTERHSAHAETHA
jgi:DNA topoisomerase-1